MQSRTQLRKTRIEKAKQALATGVVTPEEAFDLAKELQDSDEFGYAWRLLSVVRESNSVKRNPDLDLRFRQQVSLCTYKDTHLNDEHRLVRALAILDESKHLAMSEDPETLGLAGAIHKRLWQVRSDKHELELALKYYHLGHKADKRQNFEKRQGYPGINAAFILDLLASLDKETDESVQSTIDLINARHEQAEQIRTEIVAGLDPLLEGKKESPEPHDYWALATMAEAHFGLRNFGEAKQWLDAASRVKVEDQWEFESTARQLTDLAKLLEFDGTKTADDFVKSGAGKALVAFLGDNVAGLKTAYIGKVGLSLSGGGFRASLFHIGVLARLAELDVLRHVEVLSCVSGGSIVGAYYYIEFRQLLKTKRDNEITQQDYIELVRRVQNGFLKGVQTNIRTRIGAEWTTNLKMIFVPGYSRTRRLGELYEKKLYRNINDGEQDGPRFISELFVVPKDNEDEKTFNPRRENWGRANKVPILILNATTLNTGHNWQFTASWMGEPPTTVKPNIDTNYRLRRLYYGDAPDQFKKVRLGTAVAASSCVPGLFEPVELKGLYEHPPASSLNAEAAGNKKGKKITVRLVDGGVHDNQGVVGLVEQDCDVMLVSDASGQMESDDEPSNGILGVPLRSNSILMSRVRDAEYDDLMSRIRSNELRDLMFVHLKMGLLADPVNWVNSTEPQQPAADSENKPLQAKETNYHINQHVQRLLAGNRTDLDSWNNAEAYALMLSGYRMTECEFPKSVETIPVSDGSPAKPLWDFMEVDPLQKKAAEGSLFMRILQVGSKTVLKVWYLSKPLRFIGILVAIVTGTLLIYLALENRHRVLLTVGDVGVFVLASLITVLFGKLVMRIVWFRQTLIKIAIGIAMSVVGFFVARLHLHLFDKFYLCLGRTEGLGDSRSSKSIKGD